MSAKEVFTMPESASLEFTFSPALKSRKAADLLVLPFFMHEKQVIKAASFDDSLIPWQLPVGANDFKAREGEVIVLYSDNKLESRVALLGLGEKSHLTTEKLRRSYSSLAKVANGKKVSVLSLLMPVVTESIVAKDAVTRGVIEGILLSNYHFIDLKHDALKENAPTLLKKIALITADKSAKAIAEKCLVLCQAVYFARNLVNGNADDVTPQYLSQLAKDMAKKDSKVECHILGKKEIEKEKMGLLLAVNRGSSRDPALIVLSYKGNPSSPDRVALIGKGVTYDTGGLNLKPTGNMETKVRYGWCSHSIWSISSRRSYGVKSQPHSHNPVDRKWHFFQ